MEAVARHPADDLILETEHYNSFTTLTMTFLSVSDVTLGRPPIMNPAAAVKIFQKIVRLAFSVILRLFISLLVQESFPAQF